MSKIIRQKCPICKHLFLKFVREKEIRCDTCRKL